ncbi:MAG: iron-sulfur cluster insertion protein ErpA [Cytophagia bacterium]|nr:iron-sulfur cluster insertion protein ErpA [Cytophagia bacterium]
MIQVSERAFEQIREIMLDQNTTDALRVYVQGGGCSGFQYGFTFDENQSDDDFVVESKGIKILVDAMSMSYLEGAEIDYKEELMSSQFVIKNPNATTTCGCGSSFAA